MTEKDVGLREVWTEEIHDAGVDRCENQRDVQPAEHDERRCGAPGRAFSVRSYAPPHNIHVLRGFGHPAVCGQVRVLRQNPDGLVSAGERFERREHRMPLRL